MSREHDHSDHDHDHHDHGSGVHGHDEHGHSHDLSSLSSHRLWWALAINLVFLFVEVAGGIMTNSLALLADAGHMMTDVAALGLALVVASLARRPATPERTFGLLRAEVLGAFVNGAALVLIVGLILREAWLRIGAVEAVNGPAMLVVAVLGLLANLASAWVLSGSSRDNVNIKGAFLHMMADALGSVGAIAAGAVIWIWGWSLIDPIASVVISLLILWSTWGLLKETIGILLEATPAGIDFHEVKSALEGMEHIDAVHDLHIWTITSGKPVLSAHIGLASCCCDQSHWHECLKSAQEMLKDRFNITHSTLQVEPSADSCEVECKLIENDAHGA